MDDSGVQCPDGDRKEEKKTEINEKYVTVFRCNAGDCDVFAMHATAVLEYIFVRTECVGWVSALVIPPGCIRHVLSHVAALFQFAKTIK